MLEQEEKILNEVKEVLIKVADQFKKHESEIGKKLLKANQEMQEEQIKNNTLCVCPVCEKGQLIMIRSRRGKRFSACNNENCKKTFPLPQYGLIKLTEKKLGIENKL